MQIGPAICVGIFIFILPFSWFYPISQPYVPDVLGMYVTPGFFVTDAGIVAIFMGFLIKRNRYRRLNIAFHGILWPLVSIAILALLTAPFSLAPNLAWYTAIRWALCVLVFLFVFYINVKIGDILRWILASLTLQAVICIVQAIAQKPLGLPGELTLPLQNPNSAAIYVAGYAWLRPYGLTFNPNVLGGYLMTGVLFLMQWLNRRPSQILWLIFGIGLFMTFSRAAWLAALIGLSFLFWWFSRHSPNVLRQMVPIFIVAIVGGTILIGMLFPQIASRLGPGVSLAFSLKGRGEMIDIALHSIKSDLFTGLGAGNFPLEMNNYNSLDPPQYVHNLILLLAAEIGILGGMIWLWLWIFPMVKLESHLAKNNPWPIILTVTWFGWGLVGLWDSYPWALESGRLYTVTLLALIARVNQTEYCKINELQLNTNTDQ